MPQPPQKPVWEQNPIDLMNMLYIVMTMLAGVATPIIHSGFGTRAQAPYLWTLVMMVLYVGYARCPQLIPFIPIWLLFVIWRRITTDRYQHTGYRGHPWLACLIPFVTNEFKGRIVE